MKKLILLSVIFILFNTLILGQANSVELKDGTGTSLGLYSNITGAYAAITQPLSQAYVIELQNTYDASLEIFPITLNEKSGSGITNTITIRPAVNIVSMTITSAQAGSSIIFLDGTDYVVLDGRAGGSGSSVLIIENTGTGSNTNTIELKNGAENNIIRYCDIRNGTTALSGRGVAILGTNNNTGNTNNRIEFCKLTSGRYKINSNPSNSGFPNHGTVIYGCEFLDIRFVGIWGQSNSGKMYVDSNLFHNLSPVGNGPYAILFDAQSDTVFINGNKIYDLDNGTNASDVIGICIRSTSALNQGTSYITNNFIALNAENSSSDLITGILYDGANPVTSHVYFNTVRLTGNGASSGTSGSIATACFIKDASSDSATSYDIRNNIFVNERTGGVAGAQHIALGIPDTTKVMDLDYNIYRSSSSLVRWDNTLYNDMNLYRSDRSPLEQNSNDSLVEFISATDLHLTGSSPGNQGLAGISISGYTDDNDGDIRGVVPYRGADEASMILSIGENSYDEDILIYPNPATEEIIIKLSKALSQYVEIYSSFGTLVKKVKVNDRISAIDLRSLAPGIYFIRLGKSEGLQKLVIVR